MVVYAQFLVANIKLGSLVQARREKIILRDSWVHNHNITTVDAHGPTFPDASASFSPTLTSNCGGDLSNTSKIRLSLESKHFIDGRCTSIGFSPTPTGLYNAILCHTQFKKTFNDKIILKRRIQNYVNNHRKKKVKHAIDIEDLSSINDINEYITINKFECPMSDEKEQSSVPNFSTKKKFMKFVNCNVEEEMNNHFFLDSPTEDDVNHRIGNVDVKFMTTIKSTFTFTSFNDIWLYYNSLKNLPEGNICCAIDGTHGITNIKNILLTTGFLGSNITNDRVIKNTFYSFCQCICRKKSAAAFVSMEISFQNILKSLFGSNNPLLSKETNCFFVNFGDPLVNGINHLYRFCETIYCFSHCMKQIRKPKLKFNLRKNQYHAYMYSHMRDSIWDMNCCKTHLQLLCCGNYYLTLFKEEGLHAFVHNCKTESGTQMNKLTWYKYITVSLGIKSDNCSLKGYYVFLKTRFFDMNLDTKILSFKHFIVNTSKAIFMKNDCFNINTHILNDSIEGAKFQFWEN